MGLAERPAGRTRLGHIARRETAVSADADRARGDRRRRYRQRQARTAAVAGRPAAARRADRSERAGDRAGVSCRGHGPRQAQRRDRKAPCGPADIDLARPEDAAGGRPRFGKHLARSVRQAGRCRQGGAACDRHRRVRAAQPLHRQPARHDEARIRGDRSERCTARPARDRRHRAAPGERRSFRITRSS